MKRLKAGWGKGRRGSYSSLTQSNVKRTAAAKTTSQSCFDSSKGCHPPGRNWKNRHTYTDFYFLQIGLCLLHHMDYVNIDHYEWNTARVFDAIVSQAAWMVCACVCKRERVSKCPQRLSQSCLLFLNQPQLCGFPLGGGQTEAGSQSTEGPSGACLLCVPHPSVCSSSAEVFPTVLHKNNASNVSENKSFKHEINYY